MIKRELGSKRNRNPKSKPIKVKITVDRIFDPRGPGRPFKMLLDKFCFYGEHNKCITPKCECKCHR